MSTFSQYFSVHCVYVDTCARSAAETGGNPCDKNPCENGGTCVADGSFKVKCDCLDQFEGDRCERRTHFMHCNYISVTIAP